MSTKIRPEVQKSNKWWISKNRYYELKHFCLQYKEWNLLYLYSQNLSSVSIVSLEKHGYGTLSSVEKIFENMEVYRSRMEVIRNAAIKADPYIADFIFKAVTEERSFTYLEATLNIPCSKKMYFDRYRKFFYILDQDLMAREKRGL